MRKRVLSIQNISYESLGSLKELFESDGYVIQNIQAMRDPIPKMSDSYLAIIILGGPMSVYERLGYLDEEQALIRDAIRNDVPTLGICLGSQLIAQAAGGVVYKGSRKEIGWYNVTVTPDGRDSLFKGIKDQYMRVFQWHGDTYDLPSTAEVMAYSELYTQAFRIGSAFGIQFHLEVNDKMIRRWVQEYKKELKNGGLRAERIISKQKNEIKDLSNICKLVYSNFSKLVGNTV